MGGIKKRWFKRVLRNLKIVCLIVLGFIVVTMTGVYITHQISLRSEVNQIKDYGEKIAVFDGTMNVLDEGKGPETIVLLPGYGTASPGMDFKALINELKNKYRVVTIEPFGYGLSSQTKRERSAAKIIEEIQTVVAKLKIDSFILMGHSIAGIYGLNYVNQYPENVKAFVGIDTSVPNQAWPGFNDTLPNFIQKSGLMRVLVKINPESFKVEGMSEETFEQLRMLNMKNLSNETVRKEGKALDDTFKDAKKLTFPKNLPLLLFVAKENDASLANWLGLHEEQAASVSKGKVVELSGTHYLHHNQAETMTKNLEQFMKE
ncbi:alpha/beta hydrolase [Enterococcus ureilyticus]|uniref:Alpha/beta hydrolase n=1 Tax=Enterococcus ureilyticus TaxID=1131292 RepID=A0A1E5HCX1_9ENTE|nr:alpha/beta hydrolase [Enterococcus ureilyticus]MBM7687696.1 pimeloyl-ACP methyl ester carboxylesterase [Enterococcus ureilyticus]OEG22788.1 alpha/beta hydrolase [Enterococcus ureilyticus]